MATINFSQGLRVDTNSDGTNDQPAGSVIADLATGTFTAFLNADLSGFPTNGTPVE